MAVLAGHGQHQRLGLSNAIDANNKNVVIVKLTDASLEAFSDFIKNSKKRPSPSSIRKPTIQFSQNSGTIKIPVGEDGKQATFSFSLSSIEEQNGPQGSFECLESKRPGSLESQGPIQDKIQVQASDDAYARFGERMSDVKKDNERRSTQILENRAPGGGLFPGSVKTTMRKHHAILAANKSRNLDPKSRNLDGNPGGSSLSRYTHSHGTPGASLMLSGSHPMLDRKQKRAQHNPEIMKRSLRERIVHLLAVRPYKRPELTDRINREGIKEKDRKDVFKVLKTVSTMKDNTYHLLRHIWNDVSEDWEFYSDEERQLMRRRKPQNLTPPGSDGSLSSGHSSSSSHPASPTSLKRSYDLTASSASSAAETVSKKRRVSNFVRSVQAGTVVKPEAKTNAWLLAQPSQSGRRDDDDVIDDDFASDFVDIVDVDQRRRYKEEFNREYQRYLRFHAYLERVSNRFAILENQLKQHPEATSQHKRLKHKIVEEYEANKKDQKYIDARSEFKHLHEKLAHIKKLVNDFDTKNVRHS